MLSSFTQRKTATACFQKVAFNSEKYIEKSMSRLNEEQERLCAKNSWRKGVSNMSLLKTISQSDHFTSELAGPDLYHTISMSIYCLNFLSLGRFVFFFHYFLQNFFQYFSIFFNLALDLSFFLSFIISSLIFSFS